MAVINNCPHFGQPTGETVKCEVCGGGITLKIISCDIHGKCTPWREIPGVKFCQKCDDNPNKPKSVQLTGMELQEQQRRVREFNERIRLLSKEDRAAVLEAVNTNARSTMPIQPRFTGTPTMWFVSTGSGISVVWDGTNILTCPYCPCSCITNSGCFPSCQTFVLDGTYSIDSLLPDGFSGLVFVELWGAGGGGGGGASGFDTGGGGGGGGGEYAKKVFDYTKGAGLTVTVGSRGTAGAIAGNGGDGQNSDLSDGSCDAIGGSGGVAGTATGGAGGIAGTGGIGDKKFHGGDGGPGSDSGTGGGGGSSGGQAANGNPGGTPAGGAAPAGGGSGATGSTPGLDGSNPGGGGGGGGTGTAGTNGGLGKAVVCWS